MDVSKIIEPVLRPSRIQKSARSRRSCSILATAGRTRALPAVGDEKSFALDVALRRPRAIGPCRLPRGNDARDRRGCFARGPGQFRQSFPNAVFVSIHFNSSAAARAWKATRSPPRASSRMPRANITFQPRHRAARRERAGRTEHRANRVDHASVLTRVAAFDRGVRHARFHVLRDIKIPAVLVEADSSAISTEGQRIATTYYRQQLGVAIARASRITTPP